MMDIYWAIYNKFNTEELNNIKCIISDDNSEKLVIRIQSIILENEQNIDNSTTVSSRHNISVSEF